MQNRMHVQSDYFDELQFAPALTIEGVVDLPVTVYPWPVVPSGMPVSLEYRVTSPSTSASGEKVLIPDIVRRKKKRSPPLLLQTPPPPSKLQYSSALTW